MKRTILVMAMGLCATTTEAGEWRLGLFAGANIADLKIEGVPTSDKKTRTAAVAGAIVAWRPSDVWSLELRPGYVGGGARVLFQSVQVPFTANYLELPLLITRDLTRGESVRPYLLGGGAISHLTSAKVELPSGTQDVKKDFEGSDASVRLGAGVRGGPRTKGQPFLEVEYSWGSRNLNQGTGFGRAVGAIHNRGLQVRIGASFGPGKK